MYGLPSIGRAQRIARAHIVAVEASDGAPTTGNDHMRAGEGGAGGQPWEQTLVQVALDVVGELDLDAVLSRVLDSARRLG